MWYIYMINSNLYIKSVFLFVLCAFYHRTPQLSSYLTENLKRYIEHMLVDIFQTTINNIKYGVDMGRKCTSSKFYIPYD